MADKPKEIRRNENIEGWGASGGYHYLDGDIDLSNDIFVDWISNHDLELPADPRIFNPETLNAVITGRFDRKNARNIEGYLHGLTRVLDIGSGIGFIPIKASRDMPEITIMAQESIAALTRMAKDIAKRNGLENTARLKFTDSPLIFPSDDDGQATGLAAYLSDFRPDGLRIAHPNALPPETLKQANLGSVQRVIIPFHDDESCQTRRETYGPVLDEHGFSETPDRDHSGSLQFDRKV